MKIHEYQAKELYRRYEIPIPKGIACFSVDEAEAAAKKLIEETGTEVVVVKAQIHAGGRGKGGGVKVVKGVAAAREAAEAILGMDLVTHQTGPEGQKVRRLYVEQGMGIENELYLALVVDRETRGVTVMASSEGGMDIEEVAEATPEKIHHVSVDPALGLMPYQARKLAFALGLSKQAQKGFGRLLARLVELFVKEDCALAEINPLVITDDQQVMALDAKVAFDDNAGFRHRELWESMKDLSEEAPTETEARKHGLSYIQLDGNIGCLVNGAGLAMSTMDTIKHYGGEPANFLDVGGGATQEAVTQAFRIILRSDSVKGIFVNIFGGIMKCDIIANGVLAASKELGLEVPLVVRLEGTNVEQGKKILADSDLNITAVDTMSEGAQKIVALAQGGA